MSMIQDKVNAIVREEMQKMVTEAKEQAPNIEKKLEEMRKKLLPEMSKTEGMRFSSMHSRPQRVVELTTCADILGVKVNELALYFLNNVKNKSDRSLVELHMQEVYFYGE